MSLRMAAVLLFAHIVALTPTCAATLDLVTAFPLGFVFNREVTAPFVKAVEERGESDLDIRVHGPGVVAAFDQFEPTQAGVFDILVTTAAYHSGAVGEGLAIDAVGVDPAARRDSGFMAALGARYERRGLKLLAAAPTGSKGFHLLLRHPPPPNLSGDGRGLKGFKIRGTEPYHHMIRTLGGAPVVLTAGDVYVALQRGVIDGAAWGITGALDLKWHEATCCMTRPLFGQVNILILMNLDTWRDLPREARAALSTAARSIENASASRFDALAQTEFAALEDHGVETIPLGEETTASLDALWAEGVWRVAERRDNAAATALRVLAEREGLTPKNSMQAQP